MNDLKRVSLLAVVFLVLLRISIGWQFLYEGLWKLGTQETARPWSAEGYLKNAQGPLRDHFRGMVGDPDDLNWLDYDYVSGQWDAWRDRFVAHYGLSAEQQAELKKLLEGRPAHTAPLEAVPESVGDVLEKLSEREIIKFEEDAKRLVVSGKTPLLPREAAALKARVPVVNVGDAYGKPGPNGEPLRNDDESLVAPDPVDLAFFKAIERLERESAKLGYRQRLAASLKGNADRVGAVAVLTDRGYRTTMGADLTEQDAHDAITLRYGEIQVYKDLLAEYEDGLKSARVDYEHEHLGRIQRKISSQRAALVGPVRGLDAELKQKARELLGEQQFVRGPPPVEQTKLWQLNQLTIWGLIVLGALLMLGFTSRLAALGGAVMLIMFYLPMPPWPGVVYPEQMLGPEHSYIINKNLIEAIALLAIAMLPTGSWFGLDGLFRWMLRRRPKTS